MCFFKLTLCLLAWYVYQFYQLLILVLKLYSTNNAVTVSLVPIFRQVAQNKSGTLLVKVCRLSKYHSMVFIGLAYSHTE